MPSRQPRWPSIGLNSCSSGRAVGNFSAETPSLAASFAVRARGAGIHAGGGSREANGGRKPFSSLEHAGEVVALIRQQFRERFLPVVAFGEDHFAHGVDAIAFEEHVLGAAKADAGRAESEGVCDLLGLSALVRTCQVRFCRRHHFIICKILIRRAFLLRLQGFSSNTCMISGGAVFLTSPAINFTGRCRRWKGSHLPRRVGPSTVKVRFWRNRSATRSRRRRRPCPSAGRPARRAMTRHRAPSGMPSAAIMPRRSSGEVSMRTSSTFCLLPRRATQRHGSAVEIS